MHYALIGTPISGSRSPEIHARILSRLHEEGTYDLIECTPARLTDTIRALQDDHSLRGLNVTIPLKRAVMPLLSKMSDLARSIGAVNTITFEPDGLTGDNTDMDGMLHLFAATLCPANQPCVILGTGGAARAALFAARAYGFTRVTMISRTPDKAGGFAETPVLPYSALDMLGGVLVNAAPVSPAAAILAAHRFSRVLDMAYRNTELLAAARAAGVVCALGLPMLIRQAERAQEIWHGQKPGAYEGYGEIY